MKTKTRPVVSAPEVASLLYPLRHESAELWVTGSFLHGGRALVTEGDHQVVLELSATKFAVLALLIMQAHRAAGRKTWSAAGFASVKLLEKELLRWTGGRSDPDQAVRYVFNLREGLRRAWSQQSGSRKDAKTWSDSLIEHGACGYRLSVRPDLAHLDVVGDAPLPPYKRTASPAPLTESKRNRLNIQIVDPAK